MLEVLPIQDKKEQETIANLCGVPFRTELLAYKALVDGELRGICQFKMSAEQLLRRRRSEVSGQPCGCTARKVGRRCT